VEFCKDRLRRLNIRVVTPFKIDDWYEPAVGEFARALTARERYTAVILLYVFQSKILENLEPGVLKILEAQDVFTDRQNLYLRLGMEPTFFYTTKREEAKGLNRADLILAIQDKEKHFYERICRKPVITVGHQVVTRYLHTPHATGDPFRLMYVGSENPVNVEGVEYFLSEIFPKLRQSTPAVELTIAGRICHHLPRGIPGVELIGEVDDLEPHYAHAHAIINPVREGTGLKIKTIEAMGYGKPLVTTPQGAAGLETAANESFLQAETAGEFVSHLVDLSHSPPLAEALAKKAHAFAQEYNRQNLDPLLHRIDNHKIV
jgi:glycosyltransferase involved in cell wall biosynthesis